MATEEKQTSGVGSAPTDAQQAFSEKVANEEEPKNTSEQDSQTTLQANEQQVKNEQQQTNESPSGTEPEKKDESKDKKDGDKDKKDDKPAGGYDPIPVPKRPRGWTVKIVIHKATDLPMADLNSLSSDPYVTTTITTDTPTRHKEDAAMTMRTPTIQKNTNPVWGHSWIIANIPSSGFKAKMRLYDEDPSDKDDRLGNVHINIPSINENFQAIKDKAYKIEKRSGSKRAYFIRAVSTCFGKAKHMHGELYVSIEVLGRTAEDGQDGRLYTVGPCWYTKHFSPLLGRIANTQGSSDQPNNSAPPTSHGDRPASGGSKQQSKTKHYDFQANQVQLTGPVPKELYHRFVEFKPFVQQMFTGHGIKGFFLSKALHQ